MYICTMYICMYVCMYVCMYLCMYVCMYMQTHVLLKAFKCFAGKELTPAAQAKYEAWQASDVRRVVLDKRLQKEITSPSKTSLRRLQNDGVVLDIKMSLDPTALAIRLGPSEYKHLFVRQFVVKADEMIENDLPFPQELLDANIVPELPQAAAVQEADEFEPEEDEIADDFAGGHPFGFETAMALESPMELEEDAEDEIEEAAGEAWASEVFGVGDISLASLDSFEEFEAFMVFARIHTCIHVCI
jgi:hypothetical protein